MKKYTYKDFVTGKPKWTRGRFIGWERGGPLNAKYAVFQLPRSELYVPHYCLTKEAEQRIAYEIKCRETPERVMANCRSMVKPAGDRKHLFAVRDVKGKRYGYFLVNNEERQLNREALREIYAEAKSEGVTEALTIYGVTALIFGHGLNFVQIGWED